MLKKKSQAAFKLIKPGASYEKIQRLMHEVATRGLLKLGIFIPGPVAGRTEDEIVEIIIDSGLSATLYPHGVGHLLVHCSCSYISIHTNVLL